MSRGRCVLQKFPPSTHPKLYPQPVEYYERRLRNFARFNLAIVVAGLLIIVGLILGTLGGEWDGTIVTPWSASGEWDAAIVTPFFLVQVAGRSCIMAISRAASTRKRWRKRLRPACARRSCAAGDSSISSRRPCSSSRRSPMSLSSPSFCTTGVSNFPGSRLPAISSCVAVMPHVCRGASVSLCARRGSIFTRRSRTVAI